MSSIYNFLLSQRRKLFIVTGFAAAVWGLGKYAQTKLLEINTEIDLQRTAKANVKRRFQQNQQDCTFTILSLLPTLSDNILTNQNVELLIYELQQKKNSNEKNNDKLHKYKQWEELKLMTFSRTITSLYLVTFLILFTNTQLNLLGRYIYLDSISSIHNKYDPDGDNNFTGNDGDYNNNDDKDSNQNSLQICEGSKKCISTETERKFLTFTWFLLNKGWKRVSDMVERSVQKVMGEMTIKNLTTFESFLDILKGIRTDIEEAPEFILHQILLPEEGEEKEVLKEGLTNISENDPKITVDEELKGLLDETRDLFESDDFNMVAKECLHNIFKKFEQNVETLYYPDLETTKENIKSQVTNLDEKEEIDGKKFQTGVIYETKSLELPIAKLIPSVSKVCHSILNGCPNEYVEAVASQSDLKTFSVIIYTGWEE